MPNYFDDEEEQTTPEEDEGGGTATAQQPAGSEPPEPSPPPRTPAVPKGPQITDTYGQAVPQPGEGANRARENWQRLENRQQQLFNQLPPAARAQALMDEYKLSNAEQMHLQRIENSIGEVQAMSDLAPWEKDQLVSQLRAQGDPLKVRKLMAETKKVEADAQMADMASKRVQDMVAGNIRNAAGAGLGVGIRKNADGVPLEAADAHGKLYETPAGKQDREEKAAKVKMDVELQKEKLKIQTEKEKAANTEDEKFRQHLSKVKERVHKRQELAANTATANKQPIPDFDEDAEVKKEMISLGYPSADIADTPHRTAARRELAQHLAATQSARAQQQIQSQAALQQQMAQQQSSPEAAAANAEAIRAENEHRRSVGQPLLPEPGSTPPPPSQTALKPFDVGTEGEPRVPEGLPPEQKAQADELVAERDRIKTHGFRSPEEAKAHVEDANEMIRTLAKYGSLNAMPPDVRDRFVKQWEYMKALKAHAGQALPGQSGKEKIRRALFGSPID